MKKYLFLISTALIAGMGSAMATDPDCAEVDAATRCAEMGYTIDASQIATKCPTNASASPTDVRALLVCPFDSNKVWCPMATEKTCEPGDILFRIGNASQNATYKCYTNVYTANLIPSNATPVAVVVDGDNKLAIELVASSQGAYLSPHEALQNVVVTDAMEEYCENPYSDRPTYGCKVTGLPDYLEDREDNDTSMDTFLMIRTTASNKLGLRSTIALNRVHGKKAADGTTTLSAGPAHYCYTKNSFSCCITGGCSEMQQLQCQGNGEGISVRPWFLPAIGDLVGLYQNLPAIQAGLDKVSRLFSTNSQQLNDDDLHSTTLGYEEVACPDQPGTCEKWQWAFGARRFTKVWDESNPDYHNTGYFAPDHSFQFSGDKKTRCFLYFGNGWQIANRYGNYYQHAASFNGPN